MIIKNDENIVLWAIGRKGYMVQQPLLVALRQQLNVLAVTSAENVYLQSIKDDKTLLFIMPTIYSIPTFLKTMFMLPFTRHKLTQQLKAHGKLIHVVMSSPWDIFYLSAAKKTGLPVIVTVHDAVQHIGEESWLMDKIRNYSMRQASHIAVLSQHVAKSLCELGLVDKPIHILEDGLVMRVEAALPSRKFPKMSPRLLFHGRIHAYKGLDLLLDAMLLLQQQNINFPLTIAGAGDLTIYQTKIAQLKQITVHNQFMSDSELLSMLAAHDICVMPYIEASQSAVALDALWAALPTVATPVGALPQQFKHDVNALLLKSVSAQALADALQRLCSEKTLYETLSLGAHESYKAAGPAKAAKQWVGLYQHILGRETIK